MEGHPAFWGVYLAVDDVDATTAKVEAAGGKVEAGPFDVNTNGRMSAIQDPTGARVDLWQAGTTIGTQRANEPGTPIWNECVTADIEGRGRVLRRGARHGQRGHGHGRGRDLHDPDQRRGPSDRWRA